MNKEKRTKNDGFVYLWRKVMDNPVFSKSAYFHLWATILLHANFNEKKIIVNNETITIKKGQFLTSLNRLAVKTRINRATVNRILKWLKSETMIETRTTNQFTLITVLNYEDYQNNETENETPVKHGGNTSETQANPTNTDNTDNKEINIQQAVEVKQRKKSGGAQYEWQDRAVTLWKGIGLDGDPSPSFFKLVKKAFKVGKEGLLTATYASTADADAKDPEKLFYWTFNKKMKGGT